MVLYETFREPPAEFRQAPFWFWNHALDTETLGWQIDEMKAKGLGGFCMHARHGLITPYLSDAWFECIRFCCEKARKLGMLAWAYDERDWPSGPAGGRVIADPANRLNYLCLVEEDVQAPGQVLHDEEVVCLYRKPADGPAERIRGATHIESADAPRLLKAVRFESPAILWFESYLDTLDAGACREFIRSTYDLHEQKLGDLKELGLAGFFTDEPALSTYPDDLARIPWTDSLPRAFQEAKGYDLLDRLPDLFTSGEDGAQVRYDYWDVAARLFEQAFFAAIESWCENRGIQLTGHVLGEEPFFFQFRCVANIFYHLKHLHMPGMDHLTCHIGKGKPAGLAPKLIASAALLAGRERTMTETFGESGWALTLRDMKWMSDWQIAHGINYLMPHAFYYSVAGRRKKDSPPSEFFQAPFWPHYRQFADYTARVTAAMTGGTHVAKIAVLFPMSSVWADFVPGTKGAGNSPGRPPESIREMDQAFVALCEILLAQHRDFVIVDEESFAGAQVRDNGFAVNGLEFEAVIVPQCTCMRDHVLASLKRVAETSVAIAASGGPLRILKTDGKTTAVGRASSRAVLLPILKTEGEATADRVDLADLPGVHVISDVTSEGLADALAAVTPDVVIEGAPDMHYLHRQKEGEDLYFFANTAKEAVNATVSLETPGYAEIWDAETGERHAAPGQNIENGRLAVPLEFAPMGSHLLVVDPAQGVADAPKAAFKLGKRIELDTLWHFTAENGNFLRLNQWAMRAEARHHVTELHYQTQYVLPERIANMRLILDGVPAKAYGVPEGARPMMAHETDAVVRVDGEIMGKERPWEIDPKFRVVDLGKAADPGTHTIEIVIKNNGWFPQPGLAEYAWLAGDFAIERDGDPPRLVPVRGITCGAWEEQGFPYFSGTASYFTDIELGEDIAGKRVFVEAGRVGDLLEVEVNGVTAGVRPWPPYRVEVTDHVHPGLNMFVFKVANSARNFFEGPDRDHPSGLLDEVCLEVEEA